VFANETPRGAADHGDLFLGLTHYFPDLRKRFR
jgi:hypothetical protein